MLLIVGLGNPGKEYERTFHNVGFLCLDTMAERLNADFTKKKCDAIICECNYGKQKIILAKPQTYMNLSGESVLKLKKKYGLNDSQILTISDDIDLEKGVYRYRESGSAGTHNGLRNIVLNLNTTSFKRIRIGIGKNEGDLASYVLSKMDADNFSLIKKVIDEVVDYIFYELIEKKHIGSDK